MNPISKAVSEIKFRIPREILNEIFTERQYQTKWRPITVDEQIINKVLRARVLVDCDLVGGTEAMVSLDGLPYELTDRYMCVYRIPKDRTQGRSITSVLSMSYLSPSVVNSVNDAGLFKPCSVNPLMLAGNAMMNSMAGMTVPSTAKVQLIGENSILIAENTAAAGIGYIRCILGNDDTLSHIKMRSIPAFSKLCELAVKAYIYNEYFIRLDQGKVYGGFEIGAFKQTVDKYEDAETMYQEYLTSTWQKVAFQNDTQTHERHLRMLVGGFR